MSNNPRSDSPFDETEQSSMDFKSMELDAEENLESILFEFAEPDVSEPENLPEEIAALAEKYDVDVGEFAVGDETDRIVAQYREHMPEDVVLSGLLDSFQGEEEEWEEYDEFGRRVVYDASHDRRPREREERRIEGEAEAQQSKRPASYAKDDWRSAQKGRLQNRRRASRRMKDAAPREALPLRVLHFFLPVRGDSGSIAAAKVLLNVFLWIFLVSGGFFGYSLWSNYNRPLPPLPTAVQTDATGAVLDPRGNYPGVEFPEGLMDEFVELYAKNPDFAGYLSMEGEDGSLNVPVVQGVDNKYYAAHDFYKNETKLGTPFLDYKIDLLQPGENTVVYAGNAQKAYRSTVLSGYKSLAGFQKQPLVTYWTRYGVYYWKVYAVIITNARAEQDNGYIFYFNSLGFQDENSFDGYKRVLDQKALYTTGVDLKYGDKLLTISTYDDAFEGAYTVLVARMVREGEPMEVDTSRAAVQESPRYPQAYYDKRKEENPYRDAEQWTP